MAVDEVRQASDLSSEALTCLGKKSRIWRRMAMTELMGSSYLKAAEIASIGWGLELMPNRMCPALPNQDPIICYG